MSVSGMVQSFRRAKFGSAAALAIASGIAMFPAAASAIELSEVTPQTDCRRAALDRINTGGKLVVGWDLLCAEKQLKIAKQQEKALGVLEQCVAKLKEFRAAKPDDFRALGKITPDNACAVASRLPPISPVSTKFTARPSAG